MNSPKERVLKVRMNDRCACGHSRGWHSLNEDRWTPSASGCMANPNGIPCKCARFVDAPPEAPPEPEKPSELYRPALNKELLKLVNTPIVQSLLYDLDLLPEQLISQKNMTVGLFAAYNRLEGVLLAFKAIEIIVCGRCREEVPAVYTKPKPVSPTSEEK